MFLRKNFGSPNPTSSTVEQLLSVGVPLLVDVVRDVVTHGGQTSADDSAERPSAGVQLDDPPLDPPPPAELDASQAQPSKADILELTAAIRELTALLQRPTSADESAAEDQAADVSEPAPDAPSDEPAAG